MRATFAITEATPVLLVLHACGDVLADANFRTTCAIDQMWPRINGFKLHAIFA
jgi:hypothetical protein